MTGIGSSLKFFETKIEVYKRVQFSIEILSSFTFYEIKYSDLESRLISLVRWDGELLHYVGWRSRVACVPRKVNFHTYTNRRKKKITKLIQRRDCPYRRLIQRIEFEDRKFGTISNYKSMRIDFYEVFTRFAIFFFCLLINRYAVRGYVRICILKGFLFSSIFHNVNTMDCVRIMYTFFKFLPRIGGKHSLLEASLR